MRARLVRPEFWGDEVMASLPVSTRLTYMGTWCVADDAGYLEWKPRQIAAAIYPLDPMARRERQVGTDLEKLIDAGRIRLLECGQHAQIPTLPEHRIAGGNHSETVLKKHQAEQSR